MSAIHCYGTQQANKYYIACAVLTDQLLEKRVVDQVAQQPLTSASIHSWDIPAQAQAHTVLHGFNKKTVKKKGVTKKCRCNGHLKKI